jgi:hypothetical protein
MQKREKDVSVLALQFEQYMNRMSNVLKHEADEWATFAKTCADTSPYTVQHMTDILEYHFHFMSQQIDYVHKELMHHLHQKDTLHHMTLDQRQGVYKDLCQKWDGCEDDEDDDADEDAENDYQKGLLTSFEKEFLEIDD